MTVVFHARPRGRFMEIMNNSEKKKLHRTNNAPIFLVAVLSMGPKRKILLLPEMRLTRKIYTRNFFFFLINLIEIFK